MKKFESYYSLLRFLRKMLPIKFPLSVNRTRLPKGLDGETALKDKRLKVRIDKNLPEISAIDTLLHEMAHCLIIHEHDGHEEPWGIAYSEVYCIYLKWLDSRDNT